jgi:hypothetical protein
MYLLSCLVRIGVQRSQNVSQFGFVLPKSPSVKKNIFLGLAVQAALFTPITCSNFCCGLCGALPTGGVEFANSNFASRLARVYLDNR